MENGKIEDKQITASSEYNIDYAAKYARLNNEKAWAAIFNDSERWLQIDLLNSTNVTGVATTGGVVEGMFVPAYQLTYSYDGVNFQFYEKQGNLSAKVNGFLLLVESSISSLRVGNGSYVSLLV